MGGKASGMTGETFKLTLTQAVRFCIFTFSRITLNAFNINECHVTLCKRKFRIMHRIKKRVCKKNLHIPNVFYTFGINKNLEIKVNALKNSNFI